MPSLTKESSINGHSTTQNFFHTARPPGWAGIEEHFMKHDSSVMKDFADDIDNLLVFAALFSAILTTFVVQTYQLLQLSDSFFTNQLLAYQIFSQGTHVGAPPAVATTISSLLAMSAFAPSASARWINILFFFSLVLSLAAAFLGIMAKQWIREYMKWNSPLAEARENVLLRQILFENWEKWRTESLLWSIPTMLELAMILFLTGVVILLWTLDNIVAIAVTALASFYIALISAITVLPIFLTYCPYKNPTTWILVCLSDVATDFLVNGYRRLCKKPSRQGPLTPYSSNPRTWRTKELIGEWNPGSANQVRWGLALESTHLVNGGDLFEDVETDNVISESTTAHCINDLCESRILLRALDWVTTASQNSYVDSCVSHCLTTLHRHHPWARGATSDDVASSRALSLWFNITSRTKSPTQKEFYLSLAKVSWVGDEVLSLVHMRTSLGVTVNSQHFLPTFRISAGFTPASVDIPYDDITFRWLAAELQLSVSIPSFWRNGRTSLQSRRVFEIVAVMVHILFNHAPNGLINPFRTDESLDGLRAILRDDDAEYSSTVSFLASGLRPLAFWLISHYAKFTVSHGTTIEISSGLTPLSSYEALLEGYLELKTLENQDCPKDDICIAVLAGCQWLSRAPVSNLKAKTYLMRLVQRALDAALQRDTQIHRILSYSSDIGPWVNKFPSWHNGDHAAPPAYLAACSGLLHVLHAYYVRGALLAPAGDAAPRYELHFGLTEVHRAHARCGPTDGCPWAGHDCRDVQKCPLLEPPVAEPDASSEFRCAVPPRDSASIQGASIAGDGEPENVAARGCSLLPRGVVRMPKVGPTCCGPDGRPRRHEQITRQLPAVVYTTSLQDYSRLHTNP